MLQSEDEEFSSELNHDTVRFMMKLGCHLQFRRKAEKCIELNVSNWESYHHDEVNIPTR